MSRNRVVGGGGGRSGGEDPNAAIAKAQSTVHVFGLVMILIDGSEKVEHRNAFLTISSVIFRRSG